MKTVQYGDYIFFERKVVGSVRNLISRYGVKSNSYAGEVIKSLYYYYFGDAVCVNKEYIKFYKNEFLDLDTYLECHMGIPKNVRSRLLTKKLLYVNLNNKGSRMGNSFYDTDLIDQFWDMVGGKENENTSGLHYEQFLN